MQTQLCLWHSWNVFDRKCEIPVFRKVWLPQSFPIQRSVLKIDKNLHLCIWKAICLNTKEFACQRDCQHWNVNCRKWERLFTTRFADKDFLPFYRHWELEEKLNPVGSFTSLAWKNSLADMDIGNLLLGESQPYVNWPLLAQPELEFEWSCSFIWKLLFKKLSEIKQSQR